MSGAGAGRFAAAALALAVLVAVVLSLATRSTAHPPAPTGAAAPLESGPAPWPPEYLSLPQRLAALHLPGPSDTAFHIHALLRVYVDGRAVPVPAQIGIDPQGRFLAPLHTHDATGIVHIESDRPYPFTLGQLFTIWGVRFTASRIGGYADHGARRLRVFVDGRPIADPAHHVLRAHDRIIVGFGRRGSFPTIDPTPFPSGL
jgi:hypothetical protein